MNQIPILISFLFVVTTFLTVYLFYFAANKSKLVLIILLVWMFVQALISLTGFYQVTNTLPPRFALLIGPGFLLILYLFITKNGNTFIDNLDLQKLTLIHIVRIPVEITLFYIYIAGLIPEQMTFEGNNFDIISGITALFIYFFVFVKKTLGKTALLLWNFLCLGLLINILVIAILSVQTPFQQLAFDQPNIGVTFFPFIWLPCVIVPIVLFAHLAAIRKLIKRR